MCGGVLLDMLHVDYTLWKAGDEAVRAGDNKEKVLYMNYGFEKAICEGVCVYRSRKPSLTA